MSGITRVSAGESSDDIRRVKFRRSASTRLDSATLARQSKIALIAFQTWETREAARGFMNDIHPILGGRPIEIAGASDTGFASVQAALANRLGLSTNV